MLRRDWARAAGLWRRSTGLIARRVRRGVARERLAKGESARSIAQEWGVAHTTVARAVL
jgi:hypothetical protein